MLGVFCRFIWILYVNNPVTCKWGQFYFFLLACVLFVFELLHQLELEALCWIKCWEWHLCFVPDLRRKAFNLSSSIKVVAGFLLTLLITVRTFSVFLLFQRVFKKPLMGVGFFQMFFKILCIYLFYFWRCWVFAATQALL